MPDPGSAATWVRRHAAPVFRAPPLPRRVPLTPLTHRPQHKAPGRSAQHSVSDTVSVLPGLGGACPCDVRFTRVHDFAYSPQPHAVFELLDVLLVHGWVVDAADLATRGVLAVRASARKHPWID